MCLYMYVYDMYLCEHVYVFVSICGYVCTSVHVYACVCVYECMHVSVCVCKLLESFKEKMFEPSAHKWKGEKRKHQQLLTTTITR